ncbi:MAG TPA: DMT family transporter [Patescibacteria group bacterium]|nr:DMT family transporter [Patescibacteria group bacterium]
MSEQKIPFLMVSAALFWSGAFIAGKLSIPEFPVFSLTFFRFLIALPFIFFILSRQSDNALLPSQQQWPPLILLGVVGTFLYHALFFSCLKYTTAINSSLIGASLPMLTTLLSIVFVGEQVTLPRAAGILAAFIGITLVVTDGDWHVLTRLDFNTGDLMMFAAVLAWAVYSILSRVFMTRYQLSPVMLTAYTFLVCTALCLPLAVPELATGFLANVSLTGWLAVIYMALFASVLGYWFQLIAVEKIGASRTSVFVNLVPIFTIIQSSLVLHEPVGFFKLAGAAVIIAGVYIATRPAASATVIISAADSK